MFKILVITSLFLHAFSAIAAYETGPSNSVLRVPNAGGRPKYGSVDLSKTAAVGTSKLPIANGGCNGSTAAECFDNISPMTAIGDLIYGGASGTRTRLAPNTTTTPKMLRMVGTGVAGQAPTWSSSFLSSISKSGSALLTGDVTLTEGAGIALAQTGNDITISASPSVVTKTTTATLTTSEGVIQLDASGGAFTVTVPAASGRSGKIFYLIKISTGNNIVSIVPTGADTLAGETLQKIYFYQENMLLVSDGVSNWIIF